MDRILERLSQLPVIDVHTHFEGLMDTFGYTMPQFLYNCSYTVVYEPWFDPADAEQIASVWLMEAPRQLFGIQDPKGNLND